MRCRIDKRGKQVFTPQNERSKLFDKLHNITGDFQKALDIFGITETNGFKEFKNRLRPINKLNSTDPVVALQITGEQGTQNLDQASKAFNEGVEAVAKLANEYKKEFGIDSVQHNKVDKLFPAVSRMISEAYEQAETDMTTEEVKDSYKALENETLQQYSFITDKGLKVSRWLGEGEPYANSKEMLKDLKENKHLYFLPNSEAFGKDGDEVDGRAGLKMTDVYLEDGYRMTLSEVFRVVHDYFGHGILGNQFGAVGEENATLQHLDLYSSKALPAVVFQTRGQNSWVNFSGVNEQALRKIKEGSKTNNKELLKEGQNEFVFATPKDNILPKIFNFKTYETARRINEQEEIRKSETYLDPRGTYEDSYISELLPRITSRNSGKLNGFSRRSLGASKRLGGYDVDVIAEYEGNQEVESLIKKVFPKFKGTQKIYEISNGEVYREMMIEALETNKFKSSVTVHSAEDFSNMRLFVTEDGSTGITLTKDGFLGGAFGNPKSSRPNNLAQMMLLGIKEGALTAEAFDTVLPNYYSLFGFKAVSRTAFNEEYRPLKENGALEDWDYELYRDYNNGRPDVVFFIYDGGSRETIQERIGQFDSYNSYQKDFTEPYDKDSYDDAYRFMEVEAINKSNYQSQEVNATENTGTIDSANSDNGSQIDYQNFQNNNLRSHMFIENNSKLGSIRTKPTQRGEKVDSAIVYEAYRGQGVGTELYLETIRNLMIEGKILESDNSQTAPAKRIWEKLVEWGLAIKTGESNFESVPAPSWMTPETTIDEVISNQPVDRSEPSLQELMTYINFQGDTSVTKTEVIELMQANEILDSHELLERLSRAEEQGIFIFTLERLKQTGLFENYEAHKILESKERQSKIKDTLKWLRQNDNFEIQPTQLEKGGSLLSTGKIERQAEESEVTVQDLEGNQIKSNVRLSETITFDYNETLSNNIAFLNQIVRETTWDNLSSQVKDILNSIEVSALDNGIDLRGLAEKYHSATREDILGFLNSLESTLEGNISPQEFEANRNEFLNFDSITENKEVSRTEVVLGDRLDADVALRDHNLLKVAPDVYKRVPNITYTELLQAEANRRGVEAEVLNREVSENFDRSLEDVEQAKLIYLLNSNLNTQETKIQPNLSKLDTFQGNFDYIVEQFPKDFGKWVIETNNNHFKLDWRGITLTNPNQSELAFESVPDYFKEDLLEYSKLSKYLNFNREFDLVYDLDSLQVERDRVINNAQALEEYKGDYVTLKNGEGIMIRNGQGQFIKLNGLVFEQVDEHNNLVFYKPLPKLNEDSLMEIEIPKPVLESNVFDYTLYQTQAKEIENLNRETNRTDYEC